MYLLNTKKNKQIYWRFFPTQNESFLVSNDFSRHETRLDDATLNIYSAWYYDPDKENKATQKKWAMYSIFFKKTSKVKNAWIMSALSSI